MTQSFHVSQVSRPQAYPMLGGAALMMTLAMGLRQNLGLLQAPASRELGIAISDFALAISIQQVAWGVAQPFAGAIADKYGTHWVAMIGSALYVLSVLLTATAHSTLPIVIGAGLLIGVALACTASGITHRRLPQPSGGLVPRRLGRWLPLRPDGQLRSCLEDWRVHRPDRGHPAAPDERQADGPDRGPSRRLTSRT